MGLVGIITYMNGCFYNGFDMLNVGKYTSPMDAMGYSQLYEDCN